jgi:hypothetical protein
MILETLFGFSLVLNASLDPSPVNDSQQAAWLQTPVPGRETALLPLVQRATDCIVQTVAADPRFRAGLRPAEINDLIIDSIAACRRPVRAMIDAHDRMYGDGSGEAFLLGRYLDELPATVINQVRAKQP